MIKLLLQNISIPRNSKLPNFEIFFGCCKYWHNFCSSEKVKIYFFNVIQYNKLGKLALLVTDPPTTNPTTLQNKPIWDPRLTFVFIDVLRKEGHSVKVSVSQFKLISRGGASRIFKEKHIVS